MRTEDLVHQVAPVELTTVDLETVAAVVLLGRERWWREPSPDLPGIPRALTSGLAWLGRLGPVRVERTAAGRPFLVDCRTGLPTGPSINVSHSAGWLIASIAASGSVGIDIQGEPPDGWPRIERRWMHDRDCSMQDPGPEFLPEDRHRTGFLRVWTIREARCKATGAGMSGFRSPDPVGPGAAGRFGGVSWRRLPAPPGCAAAIAWAGVGSTGGAAQPVHFCRLPDTDQDDMHTLIDAPWEAYL